MRSSSRFTLAAVCFTSVISVSGCVTTTGPTNDRTTTNDGPTTSSGGLTLLDLFDTKGSEFRRLVEQSKYLEAKEFFDAHYDLYFKKRFIDEKRPPTTELMSLGKWRFESDVGPRIQPLIERMNSVTDAEKQSEWDKIDALFGSAAEIAKAVSSDNLIQLSQSGVEALSKLSDATKRLESAVMKVRPAVFKSLFDMTFDSGKLPPRYPHRAFSAADYLQSRDFQSFVIRKSEQISDEKGRADLATRLGWLMTDDTRKKVVEEFELKKAKARLLADGRIGLNELGEVRELIKKYGDVSWLDGAVKVGYVDLTATSFRDRNVFDFEIGFKQDYGIKLEDAKEAFMSGGRLDGYNFIFVTDLSAAKILREFKNKRDVSSQVQTGTRQEPNPAYVQAQTNYQQAMMQTQKAQLDSAINSAKPCYGWGCVLSGVLHGAAEGAAQSEAKKAAAALSTTPQTLTKPVYSPYNYHNVQISAAKVARVDYFVIDTKQKAVYGSYFDFKDQEKFTVAYNVEQNDPNRASILRNNQKEDDVVAWEKRPVSINLSDLFDTNNLQSQQKNRFTSAEAFLKPLAKREYASAQTQYGSPLDPKTIVKGSNTKTKGQETSGTIADERFDSVVIIKNAESLGTGFYVTPDLVLTAYHVVDKASLVEMTFYDGTKTYGKVVDHDVRLDLALIKAQTTGKPVKIFGGNLKLGETVEAIGHPKGYEFTITRGVISAVRKQKSIVLKSGALVEFVQTDTPISPGNSGGPLFLKDSVIAVNDWVRVDKASQNLNFSVSYNEVREYLKRFEGK